MEITAEGNPLLLAEKRTLSYADRKIVCGSTPTDEFTSLILQEYAKSDQRVFEVPCPHCGEAAEIVWKDIHWTPDDPDFASWACPNCGCLAPEADKAQMVEKGQWRATKPNVKDHAGFRLSALVSLMPNASWPNLVREFLSARGNPDDLRVFVNTVLAEPWRDQSGEGLDDSALASRAEPIGLDRIPSEVLYLTAGVDVQRDRLEMTSIGWQADGTALVLSHDVLWGDPQEGEVWGELDDLLRRDLKHPKGGTLRYDAALVDSGDGGLTEAIYAFCRPRLSRRIFASKGAPGMKRPIVERGAKKGIVLQIVGVDAAKSRLLNALQAGTGWRFSDSLPADWFSQLASERRVVKYSRGQPVARFERIPGLRAEALDCVVYGMAARLLVGVPIDKREADLASVTMPKKSATIIRSAWLDGN